MNLKKFTVLFYVFSFFQYFGPIWAVEKLFMQSRGISLDEIGPIVAFWMLASFLLEIPTGVLADRYSRKKLLILSGFSAVLYFYGDLISFTPGAFLISLFLLAVSMALSSGTLEAYIFDYLKTYNKENSFAKLWGQSRGLAMAGNAVAIAVGGYLTTISYETALFVSIGAMLFLTGIAFLFPEIPIVRPLREETHWQSLGNGFRTVFSHSLLLQVFLYSTLVLSANTVLDEYYDIYLNNLGIPNQLIGLAGAIIAGGAALGSWFGHSLRAEKHFLVLAVGAFICSVFLAYINWPYIAVLLLPFVVFMTMGRVVGDTAIQKISESHQRATIASVCSLARQFGIITTLLFGFIASRYSVSSGIWILTVSIGLFIVLSLAKPTRLRSQMFLARD